MPSTLDRDWRTHDVAANADRMRTREWVNADHPFVSFFIRLDQLVEQP